VKRLLLLATLAALAACNSKSGGGNSIQPGSSVSMHYTLTVEGKVVDTSMGSNPLQFVQGTGQIIPGLESQLQGMTIGQKKKVTVAPENGYGNLNPQAVQKVPKTAFQNTKDMKVGSVVQGQGPNGQPFQALVKDIGAKEITLDLNHPLAGKTLDFEVEIVSVAPPQAQAIKPN